MFAQTHIGKKNEIKVGIWVNLALFYTKITIIYNALLSKTLLTEEQETNRTTHATSIEYSNVSNYSDVISTNTYQANY